MFCGDCDNVEMFSYSTPTFSAALRMPIADLFISILSLCLSHLSSAATPGIVLCSGCSTPHSHRTVGPVYSLFSLGRSWEARVRITPDRLCAFPAILSVLQVQEYPFQPVLITSCELRQVPYTRRPPLSTFLGI